MNYRLFIAITVFLGLSNCIRWCDASLPTDAQITADLAGPFATVAPKIDLSHAGPLCAELEPVIAQQARHQLSLLHPWKDDLRALILTDGSHIEGGVRPNAMTACALATISRCFSADRPDGMSSLAKQKAIALLRFVVSTHGEGDHVCTDGEAWGGQWQAAYWASGAARAAWLLWDDLDPKTKWLAASMIASEADRFVDRPLDHQVISDTKAEENSWNSWAPAMAFNMFPHHPRHAIWGETAVRWQLSAYMTSADTKRTDLIEGKPINQWCSFPNIYDDYSLENHGRVHPDYMMCYTLNFFQKIDYDLAGNPTPQSVLFNADKIYASLKNLTLPDAGWIYPNGEDWQLHRNADWMDASIGMAVLFNDAQAARMLRISLATAKKMLARDPKWGLYAPNETEFASSHSEWLEMACHSYLLMAMHGEGPAPIEEAQLWKDVAGLHIFKFGEFVVARTDHSVSTFSWGRQTMGMVYPLRADLLCTPNEHGMIGMVDVNGMRRESPRVVKTNVMDIPGLFAIAGNLSRGNGAIEQRYACVILPDGRTIYVDSAKVVGKRPRGVELGTIGILNDKNWVYHDGKRTLHYAGGEKVFVADQASTDLPADLSSPWYNLDDLGILVLSSSGHQLYNPKPTGAACRLEQLFHLNHPLSPEQLSPTVLVFYPGQTVHETEEIAKKVHLQSSDDRHFALTLDDGKNVNIDLEQLHVTVQ